MTNCKLYISSLIIVLPTNDTLSYLMYMDTDPGRSGP